MRKLSVCVLVFLAFLVIQTQVSAVSFDHVNQSIPLEQPINYSFVAYFIDYLSRSPLFNLSFTLQTSSVSFSGVTNASGIYQYAWASSVNVTNTLRIQGITVGNNFTVLSISDLPLETASYSSLYENNATRYWGFNLSPRITKTGNLTLFNCLVWVDKGKLVALADRDPLTQSKRNLILRPAVPASAAYRPSSTYETYYFFPLNYSVTIRVGDLPRTAVPYPPIDVRVNENTTLVGWTRLAARAYSEGLLKGLKERIDFFAAFGLSMVDESRQHVQVSSLFELALFFFENRSYSVAFSTMQKGIRRASSLDSQLGQLALTSTAMPILIILFAYGLASLLPAIVTENERTRGGLKLFMFFSIFFVFLITQPHTQVGAALLLSSLLGTTISSMDLASILLSCTIFGTFSFVIFLLTSLKARVFVGFVLDMGIRDLRRRMSRTFLTLFTITIVIGASVTFTEVTSGWSIVETSRREGAGKNGLIMFSKLNKFITDEEVLWIKNQLWFKDLGRQKEILQSSNYWTIIPYLSYLGVYHTVEVVAIDPEFLSKYYRLPTYLQALSYLSKKEAAAIISTSFTEIRVGDTVSLNLGLIPPGGLESPPQPIATFLVKGKFDPSILSQIKRIDGEPLFPNPDRLILVPYDALPDFLGTLSITGISSLTIEVQEGENLIDLAKGLVFSLGYKVTANENGVAVSFEELYILSVVGWTSIVIPTIITGLIVYLTMSSVIFERRRQISVFTTLGADPKKILQIFLIETLILGFLSTFLGYFGSYILAPLYSLIFVFLSNLGIPTPDPSLGFLHYSLSSVLLALTMGIVICFLGGLIPCIRAQDISLTGRPKKRDVTSDIRETGDLCEYPLPVRVPSMDGEILYVYLRDQIKKMMPDAAGDVFQDGTFSVKFNVMVENSQVAHCQLNGIKKEDVIYPFIAFPRRYKDSRMLKGRLYALEKAALGYTSWKEMRIRFEIIRLAPEVKTRRLEDVLFDVRQIREKLGQVDEKLQGLEALKPTLSGRVYTEFEKEFLEERQKISKQLRPLGLELEPFYNDMVNQVQDLNYKIERITATHKLGLINETAYQEEVQPLKEKHMELQKKLDEMDYVFAQLRMPRPTAPGGIARRRERERRTKAAGVTLDRSPCPYCLSPEKEITPSGEILCAKCGRKLK